MHSDQNTQDQPPSQPGSDRFDETEEAGKLLLRAWTYHWDDGNALALETAKQALEVPSITRHERALILSDAATFCPQTRRGLDEALEHLEQAYALFPDSNHFACQLALTQIRLRFYDRGRTLLEEVMERAPGKDTRALAICTLALADASQKRHAEGIDRLKEARKLSPFCPLLPVAKAALLGGSPDMSTPK